MRTQKKNRLIYNEYTQPSKRICTSQKTVEKNISLSLIKRLKNLNLSHSSSKCFVCNMFLIGFCSNPYCENYYIF